MLHRAKIGGGSFHYHNDDDQHEDLIEEENPFNGKGDKRYRKAETVYNRS